MQGKELDHPVQYPETPPWTMFFDGPLYQKYDEFMKTKDFSKILLSTKLRMANSPEPEVKTAGIDDVQWDKQQEADPGSTYQYVSEDHYRKLKDEEKRRNRRTRAFILLGMIIMAAVASATALVIHYIYIPSLEDKYPVSNVNVSFSGNASSIDLAGADLTTPGDLLGGSDVDLKKIMSQDKHHPHSHGHPHHNGHLLNAESKLFEDLFINSTNMSTDIEETTVSQTVTTRTTTKGTTRHYATTTTTKTTTRTSPQEVTSTLLKTTSRMQPQSPATDAVYDLHVQPGTKLIATILTTPLTHTKPANVKILDKSKPVVSTLEIDPMDFFAMDELLTTTNSLLIPSRNLTKTSRAKSSIFQLGRDTTQHETALKSSQKLTTSVSSVVPTETTTRDNFLVETTNSVLKSTTVQDRNSTLTNVTSPVESTRTETVTSERIKPVSTQTTSSSSSQESADKYLITPASSK